MLVAIYAFAAKLKAAGPDAVGFLYYAGHGIASAGENYLIPTDGSVEGDKQSEVLTILRDDAPDAAHYLVLEACRNNLQGAAVERASCPSVSTVVSWWGLRLSPTRQPATLVRGVGLRICACRSEEH